MSEPTSTGPEPWTEVVDIVRDGVVIPVTISNVPPAGTPRRAYWFAAPPVAAEDLAPLAAHVADVRAVFEASAP